MMQLDLATPTLLFPASSLLFLAYTNRFLHLSALVRRLHADWLDGKDPSLRAQVANLRLRIQLIRWCQACGVMCLIGCLSVLLLLLAHMAQIALPVFALSVVLMVVSLALGLWEIMISGRALDIFLHQMSGPPHG